MMIFDLSGIIYILNQKSLIINHQYFLAHRPPKACRRQGKKSYNFIDKTQYFLFPLYPCFH